MSSRSHLEERFGDLMLAVLKTIDETFKLHGPSSQIAALLERSVASSRSFTVLSAARDRKVPLSEEHLDEWEAALRSERVRLGWRRSHPSHSS